MRRPLTAALIGLTLALPPSVGATEPDRVALVARELRDDPVYVSDALVREVGPAQLTALRAEVARMPFPTYVVLVPRIVPLTGGRLLEPDDGWPALLRDALGRDGVYVTGGEYSLDAEAFGVRPRVRGLDAAFAAQFDLPRSTGLAQEAIYALGLMRGQPRLAREDRARIPESEGGPHIDLLAPRPDDGKGSAWWALAGVLGLPLWGVGTYRGLRRRVAPGPDASVAGPRGAPPHPRTRATAEHSLERLVAALDAATDPPTRAFALADAASAALTRDRDGDLDDLGALVLAELGLDVLRRGAERPRCFYDPRHGPARTDAQWARGSERAAVPVCRACGRDVAGRRAPASLLHDGRPYWERDTVWARTGFGALDPDVGRALALDRGHR